MKSFHRRLCQNGISGQFSQRDAQSWTHAGLSRILDDVINEAKSASDLIIMGVKNKEKAQPTLLLDDY